MRKVSAWCVDYAYGSVKAGSLHLINLKKVKVETVDDLTHCFWWVKMATWAKLVGMG